MHRWLPHAALAALALLALVSCRRGEDDEFVDTPVVAPATTAMSAPGAAAAAPAPVNREVDERAIRELAARWAQAAADKNAPVFVSFYAQEARLLPPGSELLEGREAVGKYWESLLSTPSLTIEIEPSKIEVATGGDMAYEIGSYALSMEGAAGKVEDEGKYVVVWKKLGGEWKAAVDIFNSDKPAS